MIAAMLSAQSLERGAALPQLKGTTLDGHELTLPDAASGKVTLLILTFSKAAGERAQEWNKRFFNDYPQDDMITSYAVAMLEDVPSLFRGLARSGIKRGVPAAMHSRFLIVTTNEAAWKQYAGLQDDKVPYLLLFDNKAKLPWTHHGSFEQPIYDALKAKIADLSKKQSSP
jgi:hypothetical protein